MVVPTWKSDMWTNPNGLSVSLSHSVISPYLAKEHSSSDCQYSTCVYQDILSLAEECVEVIVGALVRQIAHEDLHHFVDVSQNL